MGGKQEDAPVRRVEPSEIRERFNESGLFELVAKAYDLEGQDLAQHAAEIIADIESLS